MTLPAAAGLLACPACRAPLDVESRPVVCPAGHAYDVARQGYLNLLGSAQPHHADTADMVAARERFLGSGAYDALADRLAAVVSAVGPGVVVEAGAGPGFYVSRLLDAAPGARGVATDISVPATRRAARAHPRIAAVVADTWQGLPLLDASVDVLVSVFAPRNAGEFHRVLRPGGVVVVALPGPGHLAALRGGLGLLDIDADKAERWEAAVQGLFVAVSTDRVRHPLHLDAQQAQDLVGMGPNAFHQPPEATAADDVLDVQVLVHRKVETSAS